MTAPHEILEAARIQSEMRLDEVWWAYLGLGGTGDPRRVAGWLAGTEVPPRHDYDVLAQVFNERLIDGGGGHAVPYSEDVGL